MSLKECFQQATTIYDQNFRVVSTVLSDGRTAHLHGPKAKSVASKEHLSPGHCAFCTDTHIVARTLAEFNNWPVLANISPSTPDEVLLISGDHESALTYNDMFRWMRFVEHTGSVIAYSQARKSQPGHTHAVALRPEEIPPLFMSKIAPLTVNVGVTCNSPWSSLKITGSWLERYTKMTHVLQELYERSHLFVIAIAPATTYIHPSNQPKVVVPNRKYVGKLTTSNKETYDQLVSTDGASDDATKPLVDPSYSIEQMKSLLQKAQFPQIAMPDSAVFDYLGSLDNPPQLIMAVGKIGIALGSVLANRLQCPIIFEDFMFSTDKNSNPFVTTELPSISSSIRTLVIGGGSKCFEEYVKNWARQRGNTLVAVSSEAGDSLKILRPDRLETIENPSFAMETLDPSSMIPWGLHAEIANTRVYFEQNHLNPAHVIVLGNNSPHISSWVFHQFPMAKSHLCSNLSHGDLQGLQKNKKPIKTQLFSGFFADFNPNILHESQPNRFYTQDEEAVIVVYDASLFTDKPDELDAFLSEIGRTGHYEIFPIPYSTVSHLALRPNTNFIDYCPDGKSVNLKFDKQGAEAYSLLSMYKQAIGIGEVSIRFPDYEVTEESGVKYLRLERLPNLEPLPLDMLYGANLDMPTKWVHAILTAFEVLRRKIPISNLSNEIIDFDSASNSGVISSAYLTSLSNPENKDLLDRTIDMIEATQSIVDTLPRFVTHRDPHLNNVRPLEEPDGTMVVQMIDWEAMGPSPKGYSEAKLYVHFLFAPELQKVLLDHIATDFSQRELIYFWRTVATEACIKLAKIQGNDLDERIVATNLNIETFKQNYCEQMERLIETSLKEVVKQMSPLLPGGLTSALLGIT